MKEIIREHATFFIVIAVVSVLAIAFPILFLLTFSNNKTEQVALRIHQGLTATEQDAETGHVLGDQNAILYLSGGQNNYASGGIISLSSQEAPELSVRGYGIEGVFDVSVYQADEQSVYDYLLHTAENKKINTGLDLSRFTLLSTFQYQMSDQGYDDTVSLPIGDTGIFYVHFQQENIVGEAVIVRSHIGSVVKEGEREYIFWTQDYRTGQSVASGVITTFNFENEKKELNSVPISSEGIGTLPLVAEADVAVVKSGGEFALVPINLRYLNTYYNYRPFQPKTVSTTYFTFTDRPLYRPGDVLHFKSILRSDDDARYTVPTGQATVKVQQGYSDDDAILQQQLTVSNSGSIDGSFQLPSDMATGGYTLKIILDEDNQSSTYFDIEYFRKPEYSLEVAVEKQQLVAGDKAYLKIKGEYFSGHPVSRQTVTYSVKRGNFSHYDYYSQAPRYSEAHYQYGHWGYHDVVAGEIELDENGEAILEVDTTLTDATTKDQVFTVQVSMNNGSGNPAIAKKNFLVHQSEIQLYRTDERRYGHKLGEMLQIPLKVVSLTDTSPSGIQFEVEAKRNWWTENTTDAGDKYLYEEETFSLAPVVIDSRGEAQLNYYLEKPGSYTLTFSAKDSRGNTATQSFHYYVWEDNSWFHDQDQNSELIILADKESYVPGEVGSFTISSEVEDRDVFVTFERARVHDYRVVRVSDHQGSFEREIVDTDMPNIFVNASSFSGNNLDEDTESVIVSTQSKDLQVTLAPLQSSVGPGEDVVVDVTTRDGQGNLVSAEVTVWAVDKALFELAATNLGDIFKTFWQERYNYTQDSHSLVGIRSQSAEMGGGCFLADTSVLMGDGSEKSIQDVGVGDTVLTRISETNENLKEARVVGVHQKQVFGYMIINGELKVTSNHKLWVNATWKDAGSVQAGDTFVDKNGMQVVVDSIEWVGDYQTVYNLEIETYHTYFAGGVWVHNQKGGGGRSIFKDTAYWNPTVRTDYSGKARITIPMPDNLTTWVVAGVGATNDTIVGQTTAEIQVTKDIVVRPLLPNIFREGDEHQITALVQNFTDQDDEFAVSMSFDGGEVLSEAGPFVLPVGAGESIPVSWLLQPAIPKSAAQLTFTAESLTRDDKRDEVIQTVPVRRYGFYESSAYNAIGSSTHTVALKPSAQNEQTRISLNLATNVLGTLPATADYLIEYPYGCLEQTTSRFVPALIAQSHPNIFAEVLREKDFDGILERGLARLKTHQNSNGGWGWWSGNYSDVVVTTYVLDTLGLAIEQGFAVDYSLFEKGVSYMKRGFGSDYETRKSRVFSPDEYAFANYILALAGESEEFREVDIAQLGVDALAYEVMARFLRGQIDPQVNGLNRLVSLAVQEGDNTVYWPAGPQERFGSVDASTALAIRAIVMTGGDRDLAARAAQYLIQNKKGRYWSNTFATSHVMRAISELAETGDELDPQYTFAVAVDGKTQSTGTVTRSRQVIPEISIPYDAVSQSGSQIEISKSGDGQLYSDLIVDQFITNRETSAEAHGIEVTRSYKNEKGYSHKFAVGDIVTVTLLVTGFNGNQQYVVLEDQLPAGLVPVNTGLNNEQMTYPKYYGWNQEITENGAIFTSHRVIRGGSVSYTYKARAVSAGRFAVPPARAELMYHPAIWGRTAPDEVLVIDTVQPTKVATNTSERLDKVADQPKNQLFRYFLTAVLTALIIRKISAYKQKNRENYPHDHENTLPQNQKRS